jgi:hypothetical protein
MDAVNSQIESNESPHGCGSKTAAVESLAVHPVGKRSAEPTVVAVTQPLVSSRHDWGEHDQPRRSNG